MEQWKQIKGYEGLYEVSNLGKVRSLDRTIINKRGTPQKYNGKTLKWDIAEHTHSSYARVTLSKDHKTKRYSVHRLVAEAFIVNLDNKECVNHIDNNALNNNVSNLEWCTHSENMIHAQKQGRLMDSQSKGGKSAGRVASAKLNKRIELLRNVKINSWLILATDRKYQGGKWYVNAQCNCGTHAFLEVGRLYRKEVGACNPCSKKKLKI